MRKAQDLAERVVAAAKAQPRELPASEARADLVAEIASEILRTKKRITKLDRHLEELLAASPEAEVVRSLPGMGVVFTTEFLTKVGDLSRFASADSLIAVAAAGIAPVLRASGARRAISRGRGVPTRPSSTSCTALGLQLHCAPQAKRSVYYRKKRAEDKGHHQAVIALACRRVDVLWAGLRDGKTYSERPPRVA